MVNLAPADAGMSGGTVVICLSEEPQYPIVTQPRFPRMATAPGHPAKSDS